MIAAGSKVSKITVFGAAVCLQDVCVRGGSNGVLCAAGALQIPSVAQSMTLAVSVTGLDAHAGLLGHSRPFFRISRVRPRQRARGRHAAVA